MWAQNRKCPKQHNQNPAKVNFVWGSWNLKFYKISKFINCKFVSKCILGIVVNAEALTTGRMIPSGTNSPPAVVSTQWY